MTARAQKPSSFANPHAETLGTWKGLLSQQAMDLRDGIGAMRMRIRRGEIGHAPLSTQIDLVMEDGTHIRGQQIEVIYNSHSGDVRLILGQWDGPFYSWTTVDITNDNIVAVVRRNPAEPLNDHRPANPAVIPSR
ncbi:MAG: hypothetical protein WC654_01235 [Patescibacteria group bacterium]